MEGLTIICNNVPRDIVDSWELTADERADFDYYDWSKLEAGEESASFIRYKGETYDLGDFEVWSNPSSPMSGWDGMRSDSFFSGILFRYVNDFEQVVVGRYFS